jgi:aminoglycoside phosphotransferase (APT) family kinase protein
MVDRTSHQQAVLAFLKREFSTQDWEFTLPHGWGNETYFAHGKDVTYFVKLRAPLVNYQTMAALGLTPPVVATGVLEDGTSVLVQAYVSGRKLSWADFRRYMERIAGMIHTMHFNAEIRGLLPQARCECYRALGLNALSNLRQRWDRYKSQVPAVQDWVDASLEQLTGEIDGLDGSGVVAAHHDICNANWLITADERIYLIDLDAMAMDDPACDLGALLWWYYPPELRAQFLEIAGYQDDEPLRNRMRLRMALHCLSILLPRQNSFDKFDPDNFSLALADFRAILDKNENPHGYND